MEESEISFSAIVGIALRTCDNTVFFVVVFLFLSLKLYKDRIKYVKPA